MEKITNLEDLCPKSGSFTLKSNGKSYEIQPISSLVESQFVAKYGVNPTDAMKSGNGDAVFWLIYALIKDKSDFKATDHCLIDEQGEEITLRIGGYKKLQMLCTGGINEYKQIIDALMLALHGKTASELIAAAEDLDRSKDKSGKKQKASKTGSP
jgi:hypothetical protein